MNFLEILAGAYAASAGDAFLRISDNRTGRIIDRQVTHFAFKFNFLNIQFFRQSLQFTVSVPDTSETFLLVIGQNQFQCGFSGFSDSRGGCVDFISFCYRIHTGSLERTGSFDFNNTHPACADFIDIFQIAQCRDIDAGRSGRFEDC